MNIHQFSQQGKRSNNEDSLGTSATLLTVCDGMGGHNYGERASAFVKEAMIQYFAESKTLGKMEIQQQLNKVQADLNQLLEKEPELEKMGTTFTGVFITPDVWYAAHIGDSRIYLFRPSEQKLWHTWDHSLVGELMRNKEITIEAGRHHPLSNRISKAIIAHKDGKPASASIVKIDELKKGDVFLLCSDGVIEAWSDLELVKVFSDETLGFEQKCQKLAQQCNAISKDNNTAIIAEIEEDDVFCYGSNDELEWTSFADVEADYNQYVKDNEEVSEEKPDGNNVKQEEVQKEKPVPIADGSKNEPTKETPVPESAPKHSNHSASEANVETKDRNRLPWLFVGLLFVAIAIGSFMIWKKTKPLDEESAEFSKCKEVRDYREYVLHYGNKSKHYKEAMQFIDKYVSDSIQEAKKAKDESERKVKQEEEPKQSKDSKPEAMLQFEQKPQGSEQKELPMPAAEQKDDTQQPND